MTDDLLHIPAFLRRAPDEAAYRRITAPRKLVMPNRPKRKRKNGQEVKILRDLGYDPSEISKISISEANRIWRTTLLAHEWRRRRAEAKQERKKT